MQTIAFYSYKGGVGRSLLLANAARFLSLAGKRVVALDLDFEAPGLHYKLGTTFVRAERADVARGAVPYLVDMMQRTASSRPSLAEHVVEVPVPSESGGWLRLVPAGPAPQRTYWTALKRLVERMRLDDPSGEGPAALLDLHARIQDELQPDYLLIDARAGVTEVGGLATTILADTVVCLFVANQESVDGTLTVTEALKAAKRLRGQAPVRVVPVLARATVSVAPEGRLGETVQRLVELGEGRQAGDRDTPKPFLLPHDELHGATDFLVAGERIASAFSPLHRAYLELFQHLFPDVGDAAQRAMSRLEAVAGTDLGH